MDKFGPEVRSKIMKSIKGKGTKIEVMLAKALWHKGIRYRKNDRSVFGKPDLSIRKHKIAIFVDSEFWHGKDWDINKHRIKSNVEFWYKKIEGNIKRDNFVNETLLKNGWKVLRFWGEDIKKNLNICLEKIDKAIEEG
ncbi:T/G mismatch-specific endonuclease [Bacteroidales bacterium 6E]|nr:T/G mismatch-specific endonuclease [Bacteroidales bacterium 6E]